MFRPHGGKDAKFGHVGNAADMCADPVEFFSRQAHFSSMFRGHHSVFTQAGLNNRGQKDAPVIAADSRLIIRSGWGIIPSTRPFSDVMPAISRAEPFGL